MGWTRGVDNATLFTCLLPGSVPAPVARVLSMDNAHNCRVEISRIPIVATSRSSNNIIPLRKNHTVICDSSILQCQQRPSFAATATHKVFGFWSHNKALKCLSIRKWAAVQSKINAALSPKCIHTRKAGGEGYAYMLHTHLLASTLTTAPEGQTLLLHKRSLKPQHRSNGRGSKYCRYNFPQPVNHRAMGKIHFVWQHDMLSATQGTTSNDLT